MGVLSDGWIVARCRFSGDACWRGLAGGGSIRLGELGPCGEGGVADSHGLEIGLIQLGYDGECGAQDAVLEGAGDVDGGEGSETVGWGGARPEAVEGDVGEEWGQAPECKQVGTRLGVGGTEGLDFGLQEWGLSDEGLVQAVGVGVGAGEGESESADAVEHAGGECGADAVRRGFFVGEDAACAEPGGDAMAADGFERESSDDGVDRIEDEVIGAGELAEQGAPEGLGAIFGREEGARGAEEPGVGGLEDLGGECEVLGGQASEGVAGCGGGGELAGEALMDRGGGGEQVDPAECGLEGWAVDEVGECEESAEGGLEAGEGERFREVLMGSGERAGAGGTHLPWSRMRSTRRSTASASGMLNLTAVLPT
jgi:hypothetical protein